MFPEKDDAESRKRGPFYVALCLIWLAVIFAFSAQAYSGRITEEYLHGANIPIRKLGHISEFALLSLLYFKTLCCYWPQKRLQNITNHSGAIRHAWRRALPALFMAFVSACGDEWHQSFVPGRSSSFYDVLVDTSGMLVALGLTLFIVWRRSKKGPSALSQ